MTKESVVTRASRSAAGDRDSTRNLRAAIEKIVPAEILRQPKRGSPVSMEQFLVEDARADLVDLLLSERARSRGIFRPERMETLVRGENGAMGAREVFVLASLELWLRTNVDTVTTSPPSYDELLGRREGDGTRAVSASNGGRGSPRASAVRDVRAPSFENAVPGDDDQLFVGAR